MTDATVWWLLAGGLVAVELVVGSFYLLMLALGLAAAALAAHAGVGITGQYAVAAVVAMLGSPEAFFITGTEVRIDGGAHT